MKIKILGGKTCLTYSLMSTFSALLSLLSVSSYDKFLAKSFITFHISPSKIHNMLKGYSSLLLEDAIFHTGVQRQSDIFEIR